MVVISYQVLAVFVLTQDLAHFCPVGIQWLQNILIFLFWVFLHYFLLNLIGSILEFLLGFPLLFAAYQQL